MGNSAYSAAENKTRQANGLRYDFPITKEYLALKNNISSFDKPIHPIQSVEHLMHSTFKSMGIDAYSIADSIGVSKTLVIHGNILKKNVLRLHKLYENYHSVMVFLKKFNGYYYVLKQNPYTSTDIDTCDAYIVVLIDSEIEAAVKNITKPIPEIPGFTPVVPYMSCIDFRIRKFKDYNNDGIKSISLESQTLARSAYARGLVLMQLDAFGNIYIFKTQNNIVYAKNTNIIDYGDGDEYVLFNCGSSDKHTEFWEKYKQDLIDYHARHSAPKLVANQMLPVTALPATGADPIPSAPAMAEVEGC